MWVSEAYAAAAASTEVSGTSQPMEQASPTRQPRFSFREAKQGCIRRQRQRINIAITRMSLIPLPSHPPAVII